MKTNDIKKGMNIKTGQLGTPVSGVMLDNQRGNRRLVDVKGSEVGMFDEIGSIYSNEIMEVERDGTWIRVDQRELNPLPNERSATGSKKV